MRVDDGKGGPVRTIGVVECVECGRTCLVGRALGGEVAAWHVPDEDCQAVRRILEDEQPRTGKDPE